MSDLVVSGVDVQEVKHVLPESLKVHLNKVHTHTIHYRQYMTYLISQ
jgi:hypothetical protein